MRVYGLIVVSLVAGGLGCAAKERPPVDKAAEEASIKLIESHGGRHSDADTPPFALTGFGLEGQDVTDKVLIEILRGTPQLTRILVQSTGITDSTLAELGRLTPDLEVLMITDAPEVTDVGLRFLEDLPELNTLTLVGTGATADGVESLQGKLSNLESVTIRSLESSAEATMHHDDSPASNDAEFPAPEERDPASAPPATLERPLLDGK